MGGGSVFRLSLFRPLPSRLSRDGIGRSFAATRRRETVVAYREARARRLVSVRHDRGGSQGGSRLVRWVVSNDVLRILRRNARQELRTYGM